MTATKVFSQKWVSDLEEIDYSSITESCLDGLTFQEQLGISDDNLDRFYQIGCRFIDDKRYRDAADCLLVIAMLNPFVSEFWLRLGNAESGDHHFDNALEAYSMAMLYDADDPYPHIYSAQIYYHLKKLKKAEKCVKICLRLIDEDSEMKPLKPLAERLYKQIEKSLGE